MVIQLSLAKHYLPYLEKKNKKRASMPDILAFFDCR